MEFLRTHRRFLNVGLLTLVLAGWLSMVCGACFNAAEAATPERHPCMAADDMPGHMDCCDEDRKGGHACHLPVVAPLPVADGAAAAIPAPEGTDAVLPQMVVALVWPQAPPAAAHENPFTFQRDVPLFLRYCAFLN